MTGQDILDMEAINGKFDRVQEHINALYLQIYQKKGLGAFSYYTYSQESLLSSPAFTRIKSLIASISSDVAGWDNHRKISDVAKDAYMKRRAAASEHVAKLQREILERKEPGLVKFAGVFSAIGHFIANLPIVSGILKGVRNALDTLPSGKTQKTLALPPSLDGEEEAI